MYQNNALALTIVLINQENFSEEINIQKQPRSLEGSNDILCKLYEH